MEQEPTEVTGTPAYEAFASSSTFSTNVNGLRLAYHCEGLGPAVLLLHGFPSWSWDWHEVLPTLKKSRRTIVPDFLGFGFSDKPIKRYSIAEQADLIEHLLAELGITSISIVAHNYGTIVTQDLLLRRQKKTLRVTIDKVALLNGGIVFEAYHPTFLQTALRRPVIGHALAMLISKAAVRSSLSKLLGKAHQLEDDEFDGFWYGVSANGGVRLSRRLLRYNEEREHKYKAWESALAAFDGPLQLIWGLDDPVSGIEVLKPARSRLPNAEIVELSGVGHYPHLELPTQVASCLDRFLS